MSTLAEYNRKRHFSATPEPSGRVERGRGNSFVIQKHHASHLHYDFRLEVSGVLKSWAVPKGPSLDPKVKRLAMQVEDHPLSYAGFEGTIPEGQYGAGNVIVWDRGTWDCEGDPQKQLAAGRLRFKLSGEKLHGTWNLVREQRTSFQKPRWLLIKSRDETAQPESKYDVTAERPESVLSGATLEDVHEKKTSPKRRTLRRAAPRQRARGAGAFPQFVAPELATLVEKPPQEEHYLHEIKFDGYRALAHIDKRASSSGVAIYTRNANDWTHKFRPIAEALSNFAVDSAYLDGEIVVLGDKGQSDFQALQNSLDQSVDAPLYYFVFDLLMRDGEDLRQRPLDERKALLKELLDANPHERIRYSNHWTGNAQQFLKNACEQRLEGIVSKDRRSTYVSGRTFDWLKSKCTHRQEFVIVGYSAPRGSRRHLGALLLGTHEKAGALRYVGRVGTGFTQQSLQELETALSRLRTSVPPVVNPVRSRDVTWVKPRLICEVQFGHFTTEGMLRQAVFYGLREDKQPAEVQIEMPKAQEELVTLTHPNKVLFPPDGPTKQELSDYYERISRRIWRHVQSRPLSLLRCPEGIRKTCFFQKHIEKDRIEPGLAVVSLKEKSTSRPYRYLVSPLGLRSLVQLGALELHTWGASVDDPEHPDQLVFDLDPAPDVAWKEVVAAARLVRDILRRLKLKSYPKLSGNKGVHVHVPIARHYDWKQIESFCHAVAKQLEAEHPQRFTANMSKAKRTGKIFVDYLRNQRGATAVAPFSPRAKSGAAVAVPIPWSALTSRTRPDAYTVRSIDKYLKAYPRDPWPGYFTAAQKIPLLESM